jgi:hypothetical protein
MHTVWLRIEDRGWKRSTTILCPLLDPGERAGTDLLSLEAFLL